VVQEAYQKMDLDAPLAPIAALSTVKEIDFFYPVIHGNLGEDGTVQGLFRLLKKPYIGSGIASSAMSFDKDLTKRIPEPSRDSEHEVPVGHPAKQGSILLVADQRRARGPGLR
jgi:D-alanine-D-alanine ligase-like ATP-grasp enzyme